MQPNWLGYLLVGSLILWVVVSMVALAFVSRM